MPQNAPEPVVVALRDALADVLRAEFDALVAYLRPRLARGVPLDEALDAYDWTATATGLLDRPVLEELARAYLHGAGTAEAHLGVAWNGRNDAASSYAQQRAAEMLGMRPWPDGERIPATQTRGMRVIDGRLWVQNPNARWSVPQTTRDRVRDLVTRLMDDGGVSWRDLQQALEDDPAFGGVFGELRAETIAITETALAANAGAMDGYGAMGVRYVRVLDGTEHDSACADADGQVWSLGYARDHKIEHPRCRRAFSPVPPGQEPAHVDRR